MGARAVSQLRRGRIGVSREAPRPPARHHATKSRQICIHNARSSSSSSSAAADGEDKKEGEEKGQGDGEREGRGRQPQIATWADSQRPRPPRVVTGL